MATQRENLRFRHQPFEGDPDYALVKYLRQTWMSPKEAILKAIRAFWLTSACQKDSTYSREEVEMIARESIAVLESQLHYLRQKLNLEPSLAPEQVLELLEQLHTEKVVKGSRADKTEESETNSPQSYSDSHF
ncbi:MAG: hypothetical protein ACRDEA_17340 [Microcystaceae cyanobacterium]